MAVLLVSVSPRESISVVRPNGINSTQTMEEVALRRGELVALQTQVAAEFGNVKVLDPVDFLCRDVCSQREEDGWLYYDDDHLSVLGAERIPSGEILAELLSSK